MKRGRLRVLAALTTGLGGCVDAPFPMRAAPVPDPAPRADVAFGTVGAVERFDARADAILPATARVERLTEDRFGWSEGPVWHEARGQLLFTDVPGNTLYGWSEAGGVEVVLSPSGRADAPPDVIRSPGANGLVLAGDGSDDLLMGDHGNRAVTRVDLSTGERAFLAERFEGARFSSPNDLVRARSGRLYFTDPPYGLRGGDASPAKETTANGVYALDPDGTVTLLEDRLTRPNGVALSPDERTLYVAQSDPDAAHLYAYDLAPDGAVSNRRLLADFTPDVAAGEPGLPDGMAITRDGHVFLAGPGGVHLLSPTGERLALIRTGTAAANAALTPKEDALYVTSGAFLARVRLSER